MTAVMKHHQKESLRVMIMHCVSIMFKLAKDILDASTVSFKDDSSDEAPPLKRKPGNDHPLCKYQ